MSLYLRQSTASQEVLLGPFVDSTDGNTAETSLTIANTDIKLWVEGATTLTNKNSGGATHISNGYYYAVLDATDTATVGKMELNVKVSGALAVRREFHVLEEAVYDAMFAASGTGVPAALSSLIATAQADLDTITGSDGVIQATDQPHAEAYAGSDIEDDFIATRLKFKKYVQLLARKDTAIATDNATELTEINASGGSGAGAFANSADALEAQRDNVGTAGAGLTEVSGGGGDSASLLQSTTIATLTNQTTFTLTDGSADNDAYNGAIAVFTDSVTSTQKSFVPIKDYVGSTKKVTLLASPKFTIATGDTVKIVIDTKPLLSATFVDRNHTWRFDNGRQTTAPNRVTENTAFDGLTKIDFTNVIDADDSIATINSVTISPTSGDEPTLGTASIYTDSMSVIVPIACTEDGDPCDTGTYTITANITTADAQTKSRACKFIVESA